MDNLVSKIPKEKLKPGKLYKTLVLPKTPEQVCFYRVWDGTKWSMGTLLPKYKSSSIYNVPALTDIQEQIIVVNKVATPFKSEPSTSNNQTFQFKSAFLKVDPKPIRYLNRVKESC